jgi:hypothetical protein
VDGALLQKRYDAEDFAQSLMISGAFASVIALDAWLAIYISALPARLALIFCLVYIAYRMWPHRAGSSAQLKQPATAAHSTCKDARMLAEITTALEHLRSVHLLLEISEAHRQRLPRAVPLNVELVIKRLDAA